MKKFNQEKLFFIIAPDRSGTTVLQNIMNTFSNFCNNKESRIAGPDSQSCWDYVIKHNDFSYLETFIEKNWKKEYFIEKSPPSINCIPQIIKRYPKANYIFLKRDPRKIVLSQLNLHFGLSEIGKRKDDLEKLLFKKNSAILKRERIMSKRLLKMVRNQVRNKHDCKHKVEIKYEELLSSLEQQLNLMKNNFKIQPNIDKARMQIKKPSSSSTFRYGIKELTDKISIDITHLSCNLWGYQ